MLGKIIRAILATLCGSIGLLASSTPAIATDEDFLAAREAFKAGNKARFERAAAKAGQHVLAPWLAYYGLRLGLEEAEPATVRSFIDTHRNTLLADRARGDWLKSLGRRGEWSVFGEEYPKLVNEDTETSCYGMQFRRNTGGDAILAEARTLWFTGNETPESCTPLFDALIARGQLSSNDIWTRIRLAGENNRGRLVARLNDLLPAGERMPAKLLAEVGKDASKVLGRTELPLSSRGAREALLQALLRVARDSPAAAREGWVRVRARLPAEDRAWGNAQVAFHGARRLNPEAIDWYREAAGFAFSDAQLAWRVRAGLRARDWKDVLASVDAMTPAGQLDPAWRYWKARALKETGRGDSAAPLLRHLAAEHHFYGLLAAEDLELPFELSSQPVAVDEAALKAFAERAEVARAVRFYRLDLRTEGLAEWISAIRGASDEDLLVASEFAHRAQIYDRAINTAERTLQRHDFRMRFLAPYRDVLAPAARQQGLEEALVLGLVRQESRFIADVVSSAGAVGLMQLMPGTAHWVAKQLGRNDYRPSKISAVDINVEFGTFYLRHVMDRLDGLPVLAAAAYNAGPGRAQAWRASVPLEGAIYTESIPFNETRDYVKKVLANAVYYSHQLGLPRIPLRQRLGTIPPRGSESVASAVTANP